MRKVSTVIMAVAFVLVLCPVSKADVIWSDGFESGSFSAWTSVNGNWQAVPATSAYVHSGLMRAQVSGASVKHGGDILLLSKPSSGYKALSLDYWYKTTSDALEVTDHIYVDWSSDSGTSWSQLFDYTITSTGPWQEASFALPADASDNPLFQFRLRAVLSSSTDAMWFDDFTLSGTPIPEPASLLILLPFFPLLIGHRHK